MMCSLVPQKPLRGRPFFKNFGNFVRMFFLPLNVLFHQNLVKFSNRILMTNSVYEFLSGNKLELIALHDATKPDNLTYYNEMEFQWRGITSFAQIILAFDIFVATSVFTATRLSKSERSLLGLSSIKEWHIARNTSTSPQNDFTRYRTLQGGN